MHATFRECIGARHLAVTKPAFFRCKSRRAVIERSSYLQSALVSKRSRALLESVANRMQDALSWKPLPER